MPCPLCRADRFEPWLTAVPRFGSLEPSRFNIERCVDCGLLQTRPAPSPEELGEAYGAAYTWKSNPGLVSRLESLYRQLLVRCDQARSVRFAARLAPGTNLLDIGCGDGLLIAEARRAGLLAFGVDRPGAPLWPACDPAWRSVGDIEALEHPADRWDIVSLFQVAEHLRDPLSLLTKIHRWLKPGGVLVLQVPNAASVQARLLQRRWSAFDVPRHLVHWTPTTLRRALEQTQYDVAAIRYMSLRDNGPALMSSLFPGLDPLVDRERTLGRPARSAAALALRRFFYLGLVWSLMPLTLVEAAAHASACITAFARKRG